MDRPPLTGAQLDRLGERLKDGPLTLSDLQELRDYIERLAPFAKSTFDTIRNICIEHDIPSQITARNMKTVRSIIAKLRRQSTSLRQIQDLVGCRVVVPDIVTQQLLLSTLRLTFPNARLIDRISKPQHGYRAMHIIIRSGAERFEVQIRSGLQDEWANLVEKLADRFGAELKYGGGPTALQERLGHLSRTIARAEEIGARYRVRLEATPTGTTSWVGLSLSDFVVVVSRVEISQGAGLLIEQCHEGLLDRANVGYRMGTLEGQWGTLYEHIVDFSSPALRDRITNDFEEEEILFHEVRDMIESLEESYS